MASTLESRVDSLEAVLGQFIAQTGAALIRMERDTAELKQELREFKQEMAEFKQEMAEFKQEMADFKREMSEFKNEMLEFKNEMLQFKNEMLQFRTESEASRREMNKRWGDLANKMGTFVEDIAAPNIPAVAERWFGLTDPVTSAVRMRRRPTTPEGRAMEVDALFAYTDAVVICESRSTIRPDAVEDLLAKLERIPELYPEYASHRRIGILSSLYYPPEQIQLATKAGIGVLVMNDDTMELANGEELTESA